MTSTIVKRRHARRGLTKIDTRPVVIFLYTRISQDREGRELGVTRQKTDLRAWAERDHPTAEVHAGYCDNDKSASTRTNTVRKDYDRMLQDARKAAASGRNSRVIIAAYTDSRLTRRPRENEDLIDLAEVHGVEYCYLRSPKFDLNTADGREYARQAAARNAGETERTAERILDAKLQAAKNGEWMGGHRPFGYQVVYDYKPSGLPIKPGRLVIDEREAAAVRKAVTDFLAGVSLGAIAREWNAEGFRTTHKGDLWVGQRVRRVLQNGRLAGLSELDGEIMGKGQWEPIISPDELIAVRAMFGDPSRRTYAGDYTRKWLMPLIAKCGQSGCDASMRSAGGNGDSNTRYFCRAHGHCAIEAAPVDAFVRAHIASLFATEDVSSLVGDTSEESERIERERNIVTRLVEALDAAYDGGAGDLPLRAYTVQIRKLETRLAAIEHERVMLVIPEKVLTGIDTAEAFLDAPLERQRAIVDTLVRVTILPGMRGRGANRFSSRIVIEPNYVVTA
jgi:site-specific DNA recombinase